jgi:hypothetical protein
MLYTLYGVFDVPVKDDDASRTLDVSRESLRARGSMLHVLFAKDLVCVVHISHDNRYVLEPAVIGAGISRHGTALWCEEFLEFNRLISQPQAHHAYTNAEESFEMFVVIAKDLDVRYFFKSKHLRIKCDRAVHIGNDHAGGSKPRDRDGRVKILGERLWSETIQEQENVDSDPKAI